MMTEIRDEAAMRALLEHSFELRLDSDASRLVFLAECVFGFTTYDDEMSELFATKAMEVCEAVSSTGTLGTLQYIKDPDNYRWYLLMVNMPFFAGRLDWGTSIRGPWWAHDDQTLESYGIFQGNEQVLEMTFTRAEWMHFIAALIAFGRE